MVLKLKKNYMLLDTCIQVLCVVAKYSRCMRCKYLCQLIDKQYTLDFISCPPFFLHGLLYSLVKMWRYIYKCIVYCKINKGS